MAIATTVNVITTALWPQGDIRDPLGVWGFRQGLTGDLSSGSLKVTAQAEAGVNAAYLYTCYSAIIAKLTGTVAQTTLKIRLLTNWPNVDPLAGVQGYSFIRTGLNETTSAFTAPINGPTFSMVGPNERFILLFDPRPSAGVLSLVELETGGNIDGENWTFEGYGYYWDRSVLNAPGGPRHPGAS